MNRVVRWVVRLVARLGVRLVARLVARLVVGRNIAGGARECLWCLMAY